MLLALLLFGAGSAAEPHCTDDRTEDICWIAGGEFWMGRTHLWLIDEIGWQTRDRVDDRPVHRVHVPGFWMDRAEVTQEAYRRFAQATGRAEPFHWRQGFPEEAARRPAYNVTWEDAAAYCAFRGKRLPTEAEWEKAARGQVDGAPYPWGLEFAPDDGDGPPARVGHPHGPADVGSYPANGYGLFDMIGNIAEWVADRYDLGYYAVSPVESPKGPAEAPYRVFRGGSWADADERITSVFYRNFTRPDTTIHSIGFRCAMDHPEGETTR